MNGRLIVFSGPACSGKSELAMRVAPQLHAHHLQMDATRARLMPDSPHTRHDREIAYRAMHFAAELLLGCGQTVILDAQYGHTEDRAEVGQIAARTGSALYLVECEVSPETAARRFHERPSGHPGLDLTEDRVREMACNFAYSRRGLLLDTDRRSLSECVHAIGEYLSRGASLPAADWREGTTTADTGAA